MKVLVYRRGDGRNNTIYNVGETVEATDWDPRPVCRGGLHGLLWASGDITALHDGDSIVIEVETDDGLVEFEGKCKFRRGLVIYRGTREGAVGLIQDRAPSGTAINFASQTAGDRSTQTAGDESTQTAGNGSTQKAGDLSTQTASYRSTQKAGDESTQKAGYRSTQTAGNGSTQTAGYLSTQTAGNWSTQTAGNWSTQTAGDESTQTAGNGSTQTAGYLSTQIAGDESTQTAGNGSTQTAGNGSTQTAGLNSVQIGYWHDDCGIYQVATRIVTENEANKPYLFSGGVWTLKEDVKP